MNSTDSCLVVKPSDKTIIGTVYEGIPETLLLNAIAWCILMVAFTILRKNAWNYGRVAMVQNDRWSTLFFKSSPEQAEGADGQHVGRFWFVNCLKISDMKIFARCGPDASHYLSFQKQLIKLMFVIMFVSICVILPINFRGTLQGDKNTFGHTTLSNLEPKSPWLWIHVFASFLFLPLAILIMRRSSSRIPSSSRLSSRTIMITHISHNQRTLEFIRSYLELLYPKISIKDIQLSYKIKKLMADELKRSCAHEARTYCINNNQLNMQLQPNGCIWCYRCGTVNALEYYSKEEETLTNVVVSEREKALCKPLGIAFVTVESETHADSIINTFSSNSQKHWQMSKAPSPSDINWENLQISPKFWYMKVIIINFILFIILFFLTTPAIIVNMIHTYTYKQEEVIKEFSPFLAEFVPTLLLLTMSTLLPVVVAYTDQRMSYWTKSKQNHDTLLKTFIFLLFMVLILPSLGLTSAQAFLESSLHTKNNTLRWDCIFLPDSGAFFVNYIITAAFIGTGMQLLRFPELLEYVYRLMLMKSGAEKNSIHKKIQTEFPFGVHYSRTLLTFTVATAYSLICPLITPFAVIGLVLKHLVDKYNIYYVYKPIAMPGEGQQIHGTAVKLVRVGIILLQLTMAAFAVVRGGLNIMADITIFGLLLTIICFFYLSPFPICFSRTHPDLIVTYPDINEMYMAPVLISSCSLVHTEVDLSELLV